MIAARTLAVALAVLSHAACDKKEAVPPAPTPADKPTTPPPPELKPAPPPVEPANVDPDAPARGVPTDSTWLKYESPAGGYSITFPNKPVEKEQGPMTVVASEFNATAGDDRQATCGVSSLEIDADKAKDPKGLVAAALTSHRGSATSVIEDKELKLDGAVGHSPVLKTDKHQKWMRVFVGGTKFYFVSCGGPVDRADKDGPIAIKTLDSLHLAKK